ncbi:TlpA disulfide reductase family protein [Henriciella sp.]|uniref:TlpA family protein disulfide reductase n=1 Tax=Henriciella sp. TaxID=1968823 RepID=UPI002624AF27|nr:TlpA disulfide reductase family protein [Henriciella sp.]
MTGTLNIGPFVLTYDRLLALGLILILLVLSEFLSRRSNSKLSTHVWISLLVGVGVARLAYVLLNWSAFAVDPWTIAAIWQGGFLLWPGAIAAAGALLLFQGLHRASLMLTAAIAVLALTFSITNAALLAAEPKPLPKGLTVTSLDGNQVSLDTLESQPFIVNLWATWCPPCQREMPMLVDVASTSSVPILLANQGETLDTIRRYLDRKGFDTGAVWRDPDYSLQSVTASPVLPTTFFVDQSGMVTHIHTGEISRAALKKQIRKLEKTR